MLVNSCLNPPFLSELGYKMDKRRTMTFLRYIDMIQKMNRNNVTAVIGGQDEVFNYHDYTKRIIKNHYVVPEGKHSGSTLNLDYYFERLIK